MSNVETEMPSTYPMNGGEGAYSYSKNSYFQRATTNVLKAMIDEAIIEKLDVEAHVSSCPATIRLADLGCSVGPNTFIAMQNAINAIQTNLTSRGLLTEMPEFQVFFNDHAANDFNTLFKSLPPEKPFYAAGVPGSFHGRLFPDSSLHFVHSQYALQWLSRIPDAMSNRNSLAWNKGKIHCTNASETVCNAYAGQFNKDMEAFLKARAEEVTAGGIVVLTMPGKPDDVPYSKIPVCLMYDLIGLSLMDMAKEGTISEEQVDCFNLPLYTASPAEIARLVKMDGSFHIEKMELLNTQTRYEGGVNAQEIVIHLRAGLEGIISKHFGSEIVGELFRRLMEKTREFSHLLDSSYKEGTLMFVVLKHH
ncbi:uncharacterized protein J3R85_007946 [Psidium guajava]|nr:uncharacterized protein J3R85_007946 [Psidium guajava]